MAEHFGFFDAVQDSNGNYDREYNAEQFTVPFDALVTNGIVRSAYEQLEVVTSGSNMISRVKSGIAFIEGHHYLNDGNVELTHDVEVLGLSRIDRVVIRKDSNPESRYVKAFIRKGVPSANPVPPTLTRNDFIYEISLAQVRVVGGQGFISAITDERGTVNIGPWAGSDILPSYDDNLLAQHVNNGNIHVNASEKDKINRAVLKGSGYHPLNDANLIGETSVFNLTSTGLNSPPISDGWSTIATFAGTTGTDRAFQLGMKWNDTTRSLWYRKNDSGENWGPWTRILTQTDYDTLFQFVSNGKTAIANAVTQKGVPTAVDAEFATMANNILAINTGKRFATGTVTASGAAPNVNIAVSGLLFKPRLIIAYSAELGRWVVYDDYNVHDYYLSGATAGPVSGKNISTTAFVTAKIEAAISANGFSLPINGTTGNYTWFAIE